MKNLSILAALGLALHLSGCALAVSETDTGETADDLEDDLGDRGDADADVEADIGAGSLGTPIPVSIYDVKRPGSAIPPGTRVRIDGPSVQVTAVADFRFWIQEAGATGLCDREADAPIVAFRGIAVIPGSAVQIARGERVRVEGTVGTLDGRPALLDASVETLEAAAAPYQPYCQRDTAKLLEPGLEDTLIQTAGTAQGLAPPDEDGAWSFTACVAPEGAPPLSVEPTMAMTPSWTPTWLWVRGVLTSTEGGGSIAPRDEDDVLSDLFDDVCL